MGMTLLQPTGGMVAPEVPMVLQAEFQTPWFFPAVTGPPPLGAADNKHLLQTRGTQGRGCRGTEGAPCPPGRAS